MNHQHKQKLLGLIQEQRITLKSEYKEFKKILSRYQHHLLTLRNIVIIISSIIAIFLAHSPRRLIRWSKRCMAIWKICKFLRKYCPNFCMI
ncbi:MAG: YqjK family protein [Candidatus Dasytiphilus stammeri]